MTSSPIAKTEQIITNRIGSLSLATAFGGWILVETVFRDLLSGLQLGPINGQSFLAAIFEAGLVGGCADWWAVTALFRHPLNMHLPHTRIIPKKKAELAAGVKDMIQTLLSKESIELELQKRNLGRSWLEFIQRGKDSGFFLDLLDGSIPTLLYELRTRAILTPTTEEIMRFLEKDVDYAKLMSQMLRFSLVRNLDRMFLQFTLTQAKDFLNHHRTFVARELWGIAEKSAGAGFGGWVRRRVMNVAFGPNDLEEALKRIDLFIDQKLSPSGEYYEGIREWLLAFPDRIDRDEEIRNMINTQMRRVIRAAGIEEQLGHVNEWLADHVEEEWARPRNDRFPLMMNLFSSIFNSLRHNERAVEQIDRILKQLLRTVLSSEQIVDHAAMIAAANLSRMPDDTLVSFIERKVGNDLQFIRLNGAMVGGLVGGSLYCLKAFMN